MTDVTNVLTDVARKQFPVYDSAEYQEAVKNNLFWFTYLDVTYTLIGYCLYVDGKKHGIHPDKGEYINSPLDALPNFTGISWFFRGSQIFHCISLNAYDDLPHGPVQYLLHQQVYLIARYWHGHLHGLLFYDPEKYRQDIRSITWMQPPGALNKTHTLNPKRKKSWYFLDELCFSQEEFFTKCQEWKENLSRDVSAISNLMPNLTGIIVNFVM